MTTYATDTFAGDGSKVEFDLTFKFIERDHVTVSRLVKATLQATVLTVIQTGTPTGDEFIWESDTKIKVGTAPTSDQELVIARDTPENDQIVKWADGSYIIATDLNTSDLQWLYGLQELEDKFGKLQSTAIKYLGAIDLTVDAAPASPLNGDFYINTGSGQVLDSWTGIGGDDVVGSEQVVYNGNISEWQIFQVPSSQSGVLSIDSTAPITVDSGDFQRPVVGITNATTSADGAMSSSDKDKLDNIAPGAEVNVNADWDAASGDAEILNKPTIPAAQVNSDWDATSGVAEILNKPTVIDGDAPSDGKTYGRKDAAWSEVQPGGVTKIIAGSNVTISPTGGTGDVTVNATGGGGSSNMPTGGGGEDAFYQNTTTIDNNYSITAGKNAGTFGPVTVNGDVTVPSGSTWTVVGGAGGGGGGGADAWGIYNRNTDTFQGQNIGAITSPDEGYYHVVFATPMANTNYSVVITSEDTNRGTYPTIFDAPYTGSSGFVYGAKTVNGFDYYTIAGNSGTGTVVPASTNFAVFATAGGGGGGGGGTVINYNGASAWGVTTGVATPSLDGSHNIASVTRTSSGTYDIVFTTPMPTDQYSVVITAADNANGKAVVGPKSTTGFTYFTLNKNSQADNFDVNFAVFATNAIAPQAGVGADAWLDANTIGSPDPIKNSFNIASVVKTGVGMAQVTFTTPMPTADYAVVGSCSDAFSKYTFSTQNKEVTGFQVRTFTPITDQYIDGAFSLTVHASSTVTPTYTWTRDGTTLKPANDGDTVSLSGAGGIESPIVAGNYAYALGGFASPSGGLYLESDAAGSLYLSPGSGQAAKISIKGSDGSIEAAGSQFKVFGSNGQTEIGSGNIKLRNDGSATFAGNITAPNVTFNLGSDNPANYVSTTNADGETEAVYNGPTLDVKALLLEFQSKIETLEAAKASLEARLSTLEGGSN